MTCNQREMFSKNQDLEKRTLHTQCYMRATEFQLSVNLIGADEMTGDHARMDRHDRTGQPQTLLCPTYARW